MIWSRETARLSARVDELEERIEVLTSVQRVNAAQFHNHAERIGETEAALASLRRTLNARTEQQV